MHPAIPETASCPPNEAATGWLYQPSESGPRASEPPTPVGAVLSILIVTTGLVTVPQVKVRRALPRDRPLCGDELGCRTRGRADEICRFDHPSDRDVAGVPAVRSRGTDERVADWGRRCTRRRSEHGKQPERGEEQLPPRDAEQHGSSERDQQQRDTCDCEQAAVELVHRRHEGDERHPRAVVRHARCGHRLDDAGRPLRGRLRLASASASVRLDGRLRRRGRLHRLHPHDGSGPLHRGRGRGDDRCRADGSGLRLRGRRRFGRDRERRRIGRRRRRLSRQNEDGAQQS